jgi:hypothetical protein
MNQARYPVVLTQNEVLNEVPNHSTPVREGRGGKGVGGGLIKIKLALN